MFGFGLAKLLFTIVVIIVVLYGVRWWTRVQARHRAALARRGRVSDEGTRVPPHRAGAAVEETIRCGVCEAFVAATGAASCGRTDCPYPQ